MDIFKSYSPERILVVNLGGLGDMLLSTPALKALKMRYPRTRMSLTAARRVSEFAKGLDYIDEIFTFEPGFTLSRIPANLAALWRLRRKRFDIAVNMRTLVSSWSAFKMKIFFDIVNPRISAGRNTDGRGAFFDVRIPETGLGEKYEMDYDIDMAKALGAPAPEKRVDFQVSDEDLMKIKGLLDNLGVPAADDVVTVNTGGKPSHRWPAENFARVMEIIGKKTRCAFVITGDRKDAGFSSRIKALSGMDALDLTGKLDIRELGALIKLSGLFISNDTGPMHIAAALKTPLVAIFGPGYLTRFDPRNISDRTKVLYKKEDCAPCDRKFCATLKCLRSILPDEVAQAALDLLLYKGSGSGRSG